MKTKFIDFNIEYAMTQIHLNTHIRNDDFVDDNKIFFPFICPIKKFQKIKKNMNIFRNIVL